MRTQFNAPWERRLPGGDGEEGMLISHGGQIQDTIQPTLNSILPRGLTHALPPPFSLPSPVGAELLLGPAAEVWTQSDCLD